MTLLVPALTLLFLESGFGSRRTGSCLPVCSGGDCITVNQDRVDFQTAEETCRDRNGELLTLQSETHQQILKVLIREMMGNFWIGLRLPAGSCSDLSVPLRGYEWTSGNTNRTFTPPSISWAEELKLCSPRCVSLSYHQKWTERFCSDKTDGFLCKTNHQHACQQKEMIFSGSKGCESGPCEHECSEVKGGYKCSCFQGYRPDRSDPKQCRMFCGQKTCPQVCEGHAECSCPDGFIRADKTCEDIDECEMQECDKGCLNSFGSFMCFCPEGFALKDLVHCVPAAEDPGWFRTTPGAGFVKPVSTNTTLKVSTTPAGVFLWIWVAVVVVLVALVFLIRFYLVRRRRQNQ